MQFLGIGASVALTAAPTIVGGSQGKKIADTEIEVMAFAIEMAIAGVRGAPVQPERGEGYIALRPKTDCTMNFWGIQLDYSGAARTWTNLTGGDASRNLIGTCPVALDRLFKWYQPYELEKAVQSVLEISQALQALILKNSEEFSFADQISSLFTTFEHEMIAEVLSENTQATGILDQLKKVCRSARAIVEARTKHSDIRISLLEENNQLLPLLAYIQKPALLKEAFDAEEAICSIVKRTPEGNKMMRKAYEDEQKTTKRDYGTTIGAIDHCGSVIKDGLAGGIKRDKPLKPIALKIKGLWTRAALVLIRQKLDEAEKKQRGVDPYVSIKCQAELDAISAIVKSVLENFRMLLVEEVSLD